MLSSSLTTAGTLHLLTAPAIPNPIRRYFCTYQLMSCAIVVSCLACCLKSWCTLQQVDPDCIFVSLRRDTFPSVAACSLLEYGRTVRISDNSPHFFSHFVSQDPDWGRNIGGQAQQAGVLPKVRTVFLTFLLGRVKVRFSHYVCASKGNETKRDETRRNVMSRLFPGDKKQSYIRRTVLIL